ncbi:hypothetical protein BKA80DRAFT_199522, partial [Phyllosticta citrichinensis]
MSSIFELLAQNQPSFQTHQALIVIGLQNDFCSPTGKLPVSKPDGLLHRIRKIIPAFRDHAGSIIWVRTEADPAQPAPDGSDDADAVITSVPGKRSSGDDDDSSGLTEAELQPSDLPLPRSRRSRRRPADLLRRVTERNREDEIEAPADPSLEEELFLANGSGICLAGGHGAAFADDIASEVRSSDIIVTKRWYSALRGTNLLLTLRTRLITELFVCGCISNISVYATAAEAARHGITIYLIDDCIGYRKLDRHQEAMKQMVEYMGAYLISFDEAMKRITGNSQGEMTDAIGEGDSHLVHDFLSDEVNAPGTTRPFKESIFDKLCNEVRFQKMLHATGEVPRLVAVQGDVGPDGSMPIYRHPSDQSLPLLHFSPSVLLLRKHVEQLVQHPMNHVLIQFYRQGGDHISEHSDKTLDIVRGSSIVNVSFGAQRTMRLRTKRSENTKSGGETVTSNREIQRVAMPHNSALVTGPATNTCWLHGIMPDKRPSTEKVLPETIYMGMRISLTFRHIGTFISPDSRLIWGQGASSKQKADATPVVSGDEKATESIIRAFSAENQQTGDKFDWDATYGAGFDVL